jgi:predicted dehydrogenase
MSQNSSAAPPVHETTPGELRLGAIGVDSSHLPEFTKRIAELNRRGETRCRVTAFWRASEQDMPVEQVDAWVAEARSQGAEPVDDLETMLDQVDGVMVLAVAGHKHLALAEAAIRRGLPTYIDKPLACHVAEARRIRQLAIEHDTPCYSASSLRFATEPESIDRDSLGELKAVDAFGPGELHPLMPGVLFYGVHTIEMVDAIWGPGVEAVAAEHHADRDLVRLRYADGRFANLRLERAGAYDFGATVHGEQAITSFKVDFANVYDRLVDALAQFFETHEQPVTLERTVENVAVMVAANASMDRNGAWVDVE